MMLSSTHRITNRARDELLGTRVCDLRSISGKEVLDRIDIADVGFQQDFSEELKK